jgi:hypothetical protein
LSADEVISMARQLDLTGAWQADDLGIYYIRHLNNNTIWWAGLSAPWFFHAGLFFTNVFRGTVDTARMTITGAWADVPRGNNLLQQGDLDLDIVELTPTEAIRAEVALRVPTAPRIPPAGDTTGTTMGLASRASS